MTPASAIPLRYVVTPTVKQLYDDDQEGFDAIEEAPVLAKLSAENDRVDGLEGLYGYILNNSASVPMDAVSGNEGFFESIKSGGNKLIKTVKDFFKWLWSFFGSKQKSIDIRTRSVNEKLNKNGAKDEDVAYPRSVSVIYPKPGKPDSNINWLGDSITNIVKGIDKATEYTNLLSKLHIDSHTVLTKETPEDSYKTITDRFKQGVATTFKLTNKPSDFVGKADLSLKDDRFVYHQNITAVRNVEGVKFRTTTSQLQGYAKDYGVLKKKMDILVTNVSDLEGRIVKALENHLIVAGRLTQADAEGKKVIEETRVAVRAAMANIKVLQTAIFRSANAVLDVISAATK